MQNLQQDFRTIEKAIAEVRLKTRAELVLVLRKSSGNYKDIDCLVGAVGAILILVFAAVSPYDFSLLSLPIPLVLAFLCGVGISRKSNFVRALFVTKKRKHNQARKAAAAVFTEKELYKGKNRAAVLLYYSAMERTAEIICDVVAEEVLSKHHHHIHRKFDTSCNSYRRRKPDQPLLAEFLKSFGVLLQRELPLDHYEATRSTANSASVDLNSEDSL